MRRLTLLLVAAAAVTVPAGAATAGCVDTEPCLVQCVRYIAAHLDPDDPRLVCPR